jgi:hypothetical protein
MDTIMAGFDLMTHNYAGRDNTQAAERRKDNVE